jgi:anti-sigma factor RsiW
MNWPGWFHPDHGALRASLDDALSPPAQQRLSAHLERCSACRQKLTALQSRRLLAQSCLAAADSPVDAQAGALRARSRLQQIAQHRSLPIPLEEPTMMNKLFNRRTRPAWTMAALIAILAVALAFPQVRAAAADFLGLFRVQKIAVVQINPAGFPSQLGQSTSFETMLSDQVQFTQDGEAQDAASAEEASGLAGFTVRLPKRAAGDLALHVQPGGTAEMTLNLALAQAVLDEIGRSDLRLPAELDGAAVKVQVARSVTAMYGECQLTPEQARAAGYDPDDGEMPRLPDCTTLMQMPSPTINAPAGLDIQSLGEVYLQVMGLSSEEAAVFARNVDWATTLVIPLPRYQAEYSEVTVDGVEGTLIQRGSGEVGDQYLLLWVKDGIVYALTGPGNRSAALTLGNSLK